MCQRCNRLLLRAPVLVAGMSLGPKCARAVAGHQQDRRQRRHAAPMSTEDIRQADLFKEMLS